MIECGNHRMSLASSTWALSVVISATAVVKTVIIHIIDIIITHMLRIVDHIIDIHIITHHRHHHIITSSHHRHHHIITHHRHHHTSSHIIDMLTSSTSSSTSTYTFSIIPQWLSIWVTPPHRHTRTHKHDPIGDSKAIKLSITRGGSSSEPSIVFFCFCFFIVFFIVWAINCLRLRLSRQSFNKHLGWLLSKAQSSTPKLITWRDYTHRRAFSALLCVSAYPPIGMNVFCYQTHTYTQASFVSPALWHSVVCVRFIHRRATSFSPALHVPCFFCVIHTHTQASYTSFSPALFLNTF